MLHAHQRADRSGRVDVVWAGSPSYVYIGDGKPPVSSPEPAGWAVARLRQELPLPHTIQGQICSFQQLASAETRPALLAPLIAFAIEQPCPKGF